MGTNGRTFVVAGVIALVVFTILSDVEIAFNTITSAKVKRINDDKCML